MRSARQAAIACRDRVRLRPDGCHAPEAAPRPIARVSSHDQKEDLERQKPVHERYCARQGGTFALIADSDSGMNTHQKDLKRRRCRL